MRGGWIYERIGAMTGVYYEKGMNESPDGRSVGYLIWEGSGMNERERGGYWQPGVGDGAYGQLWQLYRCFFEAWGVAIVRSFGCFVIEMVLCGLLASCVLLDLPLLCLISSIAGCVEWFVCLLAAIPFFALSLLSHHQSAVASSACQQIADAWGCVLRQRSLAMPPTPPRVSIHTLGDHPSNL